MELSGDVEMWDRRCGGQRRVMKAARGTEVGTEVRWEAL